MSLDELEEAHQIGPAPGYYVDTSPIEKGAQGQQLIPRKAVFSEQISEQGQNLHPDVSQNRPILYDGHPWEPGIWRQFPLRGILPLLFSLFCMAGSIAILY
jgi:hypothetical protein